jgi:GMP synthase (glutamine-hydrolysing)
MFDRLRYLLLQVRNPDDLMRAHEVGCFQRALAAPRGSLRVHDLLGGRVSPADLDAVDVVLLGGSGHYSATSDEPWIEPALDTLRELHALRKPTFASCWGFQALARALGGRVVNDPSRAELGTLELRRTDAGRDDPVFGPLGARFHAQMGHEDVVVELPPNATLLASSARVENQAYRLNDAPIYCTQFHPELRAADLLTRVRTYPEYVERIAGVPYDQFARSVHETPAVESVLRRFVSWVTPQS